MNHPLVLVMARLLIASIFIVLGGERLLGAAGIGPLAGASFSNVTLLLSAFELIVGLLIAVGWRVRPLALLMAAFLIVDAVLSHPFWRYTGSAQHAQVLHFFKNLSVIGGLLLLATMARRAR
jgi:putative oxidoreductase